MTQISVAHSDQRDPKAAARELASALAPSQPTAVLFFASSSYDADAIAHEVHDAFGGAQTFGCTTAGELISGRMLKQSIVAMGFGAAALPRLGLAVVENLGAGVDVQPALASLAATFGVDPGAMDPTKVVGIALIDGLSRAEERVMEKVGDATDVTFIGGSAGDDVKFERTYVFANGRAFSDAAVLAALEPHNGFDFLKTQSFRISEHELVATRVDEATRTVLEFDGKPARLAYSDALGVPPETLADQFMSHPVGLIADGEPFVRSPQQLQGDSVVFYCGVKEGAKLSVLDATDIVADTAAALERYRKEQGEFTALVNFHCILRTLELEAKEQTEAYGKVFDAIPMVGLSTYGEEFVGHINQTSTMLILR